MTKLSKTLLLLATLVPLVFLAVHLAIGTYRTSVGLAQGPMIDNAVVNTGVHLVVMLFTIVLVVFYSVFLARTDAVKGDMKVLWAIALLSGFPIVMPIFWYLHIWSDKGSPPSGSV